MSRLEEGTVRAGQVEMDYFRFGSGSRTMVIIPGLSVRSVVLSAGAVAQEYRMMEDAFTVYVFDRRKQLPPVYSVREMAEDTVEAVRELGLTGLFLFGASQGGMIAQLIAIEHPELVQRLALGSTCCKVEPKRFEGMEKWIRLAKAGDGGALYQEFGKMIYPLYYYEQYGRALEMLGKMVTEEEMERFAILTEGARGFDISSRLDQIRCPVLVLGAMDDAVLGSEGSFQIADALKANGNCELYMYDGYGHAAFDVAPDYQDRLLRFFTQ
jgi:pimeloyl-ACP methyl ester carboxylesterase